MRQLNWLGVVLGLVVSELIGMAWYGTLFREEWMAQVKPDMNQANTTLPMIIGALDVLVMVVGVAWLVRRLDWDSLSGGIRAGVIAAVAFAIPGVLLDPIYAGRSGELMMIEAGYVALVCIISGGLIGAVKLPQKKLAAA